MGRIEFWDLNIFGIKTQIPPEIKGRSSGAQLGPEWSVYYLRNIHSIGNKYSQDFPFHFTYTDEDIIQSKPIRIFDN